MNRLVMLSVLPLLTLLGTESAFAHAKLLKSQPSANQVVTQAPSEVVLHFSEELEIPMCKVEVKNVATGEVVSDGAITMANDGKDESSMRIALKSLAKSKAVYDVSWKAVAKDAHKMPGHMQFIFDPKK